MSRSSTAGDDPQGYGLGVSELALPTPFGLVWWYEGETLGFRVLHMYVPRSGTLFAVAVNSNTSDSADRLYYLGESILVILHDAGAA